MAWAWVAVIANAAAGLWALGAHWLPVVRSPALWWFTAVAQLTMFVQVILGVVLVAAQDLEAPDLHAFYGFIALIAIAIIYSYRSQLSSKQYLLYGLGGLFVMGLGIRAMFLT